MLKDDFLKIADHTQLADFFGLKYSELARTIYKTDDAYKYHQFSIRKKLGSYRKISSPSTRLKTLQNKLKDVLYEIYPTKSSVHGFAKNKSIVTNAGTHLRKKYIFNIDLENFFGSIHFGRVQNLFRASPFKFSNSVSTILAQICCFKNELPQGAPTSPIISNLIAWKMDSQLQHLAKVTSGTYTRYADDISFSYTCAQRRLPKEVIVFRDGEASPGNALTHIIESNGFNVNYSKVRLCDRQSRMEVTGLTVNEFPNVKRQYIRQISSVLHAWRKHGYSAAEKDFNEKYDFRQRASGKPKSLCYVIKGKLAFLRSVRSGRDRLFNKLAKQFNNLVDEKHKFKIFEITDTEKNAVDSLWVIETCYDYDGEVVTSQGTGFSLTGVGIVTCAHVVSSSDGKVFQGLEAFKHDSTKRYPLIVERMCAHRDIAICSISTECNTQPGPCIDRSPVTPKMKDDVTLLGFPGYAPGQGHYLADSKIARLYTQRAVTKFEISDQIREGNSGGPVINEYSQVVGIALEGAAKHAGNNGCLMISEIDRVMLDENYKVPRTDMK